MRSVAFSMALTIVVACSTGCAQWEQQLSGPSGSDSTSLLGAWTSGSPIGAALSSCTNFHWQLTAQQGGTVSGDASATCGSVNVSGTVTGTVNGSDVPYQITGTADVPGLASCPFSISGTAHLEGDAIRVPYSGTTCLGPAQGEEVLRRPSQPTPAPDLSPAPPPPAVEPPSAPPASSPGSSFHVAPGPLAGGRAEQVVRATAGEFPYLLAPRPTDAESLADAAELLRRMIWHMQLAGFDAGRQRNPSGALSSDKMTVFADGAWHAYDVFYSVGTANQPTTVIFLEVFPANPVADGGIPD